MQLTTEDSEKDIIIKDLYYINDLAYENTENYKLYPQISQIAQMRYLATNKHEITQIKHEMSFSFVFICVN